MEIEDFDVFFFPRIAVVSYVFLLLAFVVVVVIAIRTCMDRKRKDVVLWIVVAIFMLVGVICQSQIRYTIQDYIEEKNYKIVVAVPHLLSTEYKEVDYMDYWQYMNWYTYKLDCETKTIYMQRTKFY